MEKFYLTTPIYYINGKPSVGHAYTTIAADIIARYQRLLGKEVFFLTGTDENGQKNTEAAEKAGKGDDVPGYLDDMAALWQKTFEEMGVTHNRFIRTTEEDHKIAVEAFWKRVEATGDIYKGEYEGLYCKGCEAFITESDLVDGQCPHHQTAPEVIKEENYFFKLTKYREALLKHIDENPNFIMPKKRRNEVRSYVEKFMTDVSISRSSLNWGIPVPGDESQVIYVWFDALINYLTGVGFGKDNAQFEATWPADVHLVGKDIIKFHCALWPAMLLSAGLPLPKQIYAHGFFTIDGIKMSKSLGNVVDPIEVKNDFSNDVLRYFLMREIRFGEDGDYSAARMEERYNGELANELGNLANRVLAMTGKYFDSIVPEKTPHDALEHIDAYHDALSNLHFHDGLEAIWSLVREANQFVEQKKPWVLAKEEKIEELAATMYVLLEMLRHIGWLLVPFMPDTAEKLLQKLGQTSTEGNFESKLTWGLLNPGSTIEKGEPLFPRRETNE